MTIKEIIDLLKKDGINSKQQVIDLLENMTVEQIIILRRDLNERLRKKIVFRED